MTFPGSSRASFHLQILDQPVQMAAIEELQRRVWPGNETEIVPGHLLLTAAHNGGLVIGAFVVEGGRPPAGPTSAFSSQPGLAEGYRLAGFVFGCPGLYATPDGPRLKHCSHMLAVDPEQRDLGLGFALKRAQWQMVRQQGIDRITWTYDPLLSRNGYLNIARLGAVCSTYLPDAYGTMYDALNAGLPSDRFQVDWWVNTRRVALHLSKRPRLQLDLAHYLAAGAEILNPSGAGSGGFPMPAGADRLERLVGEQDSLLLVEIPADFQALRHFDLGLALTWRLHTRSLFERLFAQGFVVTDFIHLPGAAPRSFYVLSHGDAVL